MTATEIIKHLNLKPLDLEGGFYKRVYEANTHSEDAELLLTHIYYLVTPSSSSRKHRLKTSHELFNFYLGDPVVQKVEGRDGIENSTVLGSNLLNGESLTNLVPPGFWQEASLVPGGKWALLGCTVVPGFKWDDFEKENG